jgi:hypothetical protein
MAEGRYRIALDHAREAFRRLDALHDERVTAILGPMAETCRNAKGLPCWCGFHVARIQEGDAHG